MGEAKRRKELGIYPEQTRKPYRKPKRQVEREVMQKVMGYMIKKHPEMMITRGRGKCD